MIDGIYMHMRSILLVSTFSSPRIYAETRARVCVARFLCLVYCIYTSSRARIAAALPALQSPCSYRYGHYVYLRARVSARSRHICVYQRTAISVAEAGSAYFPASSWLIIYLVAFVRSTDFELNVTASCPASIMNRNAREIAAHSPNERFQLNA